MMKIIALIPYWSEYQFPDKAIKNRDTLKVGGHTLLERVVKLCNEVDVIEQVIIYTSNTTVSDYIDESLSYTIEIRDKALDRQNVSIEKIIQSYLDDTDADLITLMHPRCPFISVNTVKDCIEAVVNGDYDSAFVATSHNKLAWYQDKPLNYSIDKNSDTPNVSEIYPVILESSAVYVFSKDGFENYKRRVGAKPYIKIISKYEGFDIASEDDYEIADLLVNAGFDK